jgi:hypothetical protein
MNPHNIITTPAAPAVAAVAAAGQFSSSYIIDVKYQYK